VLRFLSEITRLVHGVFNDRICTRHVMLVVDIFSGKERKQLLFFAQRMPPSDSQKVIVSHTTTSSGVPRFTQPVASLYQFQPGMTVGSFLPYPQPYVTNSMGVPVPATSTQQFLPAPSYQNVQASLGAPFRYPTSYHTSQSLSSYPTYSANSVGLPSSNSQYVLSAENTLITPSRRVITMPVSHSQFWNLAQVNENQEPSPGRATRPTSLGPLDAPAQENKNESVNSSILPFQENRPLMTSPTRRNRAKLKGELVGQRVAEIESDILKRSMNVPKKQQAN
jgi:hypothetical protein